jgi:PAS domain S-box-containing protein
MEAKKILESLRKRREFFPYAIFTLGIILTFAAAIYLAVTSRREDLERFDNVAVRAKEGIKNRVDRYTTLLKAGGGLFAASDAVTKSEFKTFSDQLALYQQYQGVQGIAYAIRITEPDKEAEIQRIVREGVSNFSIRPLNPSRSEYYVIAYFEPEDAQNNAAIGFDVFSEPMRRAAMEKARDTGRPQATKRLVLADGDEYSQQPGFVLYVPIYKNGLPHHTVSQRRQNIQGFIFSPFRANDLLGEIYKAERADDIRLVVYEGEKEDPSSILYDSNGVRSEAKNHKPFYARSVPLEIAGQRWTLSFSSLPEFERASETNFIPYVLLFGIISSTILFYITRLQIKARKEAVALAEDLFISEQALKDSNRQVRNIVESITDGFIAFDRSWRFTYVNKEAGKTLGQMPKALIGKNFWDEFPHFHDTPIGDMLSRAMRDRRPSELDAYYKPSKQWLAIRVYPSRNGISVYFQNITDRVRLERQKDEFLGIASHELKTPVTSLKSYAQVMYRRFQKKGDKESAEHLLKMDGQLDKLTLLISDLLDVTKIEAGKILFSETEFALQPVVKEIIEELQRTTDRHKIVVKGRIARAVYGDKERIGQVISNLLSNAIKYSPSANRIVVTLSENKNEAIVCVRDFGVGIPKKTLHKVFERFFRVSGPRQETFPGLGLGLYISSEIIKRQGGKIWVDSEEGMGSNFCFSIPFVDTKKH